MYLILKFFLFFRVLTLAPERNRHRNVEEQKTLLRVSTLRSGNPPFPGVGGLPSELNMLRLVVLAVSLVNELCVPKSSRDSPFDVCLFLFFLINFL